MRADPSQLAYEVERLSRITVILMRPGNSISFSICAAISCEISAARSSSTSPGSTITRISRPARIANTRSTPSWAAGIPSRARSPPPDAGLRSPVPEGDLGADQRVRALDLVRARLPNVVQQRRPPGSLDRGPELAGH